MSLPSPGDVVDGYRLDAVIGRGGMGTVYRGTDLALDKTVAVKVVAADLASDPKFVDRFRVEAQALARLDHPGIVRVLAFREVQGVLALVMEHVSGPSLAAFIARHAPLAPARALPLFRRVAAAVRHAHDEGVLHRDLKPSNILLTPDGQPKITDFGLARILALDDRLTSTHERAGTTAYMAPEQIRGLRNTGPPTDLFALGLLFYEVLTGRLPYSLSGGSFEIQRRILESDFPPPSAFAADLPPALDELVEDLLIKDPEHRLDDPDALVRRLEGVQTSGTSPLPLFPADRREGLFPSGPRRWSWIVGGTMGVALVLLAGLFVFLPNSPPPDTVLDVDTEPPGARVSVNGVSIGETPIRQAHSGDDTLRVVVEKEPYARLDTQLVGPGSLRLSARLVAAEASPPDTSTRLSARPPASDPDPASRSPARSSPAVSAPPERAASSRLAPPASTPPSDRRATNRGRLIVDTTPPGAAVTVDGEAVGQTPVSILRTAREHSVHIQHPGYQPIRTTVRVRPGDTTVLRRALSPRRGTLQLRITPAADVYLNGSLVAQNTRTVTADTLSPGPSRVTVVSPQGRWEERLTIRPGDETQRIVDFRRQVDVTVVTQTPTGTPIPHATLRVDGIRRGYTPQRLSVGIGQRVFRVEQEGYTPAERTIQITPDMQTPLVLELRRRP